MEKMYPEERKSHDGGFLYDDILNLPYKRSARHAHMATGDRAAQFSPFAALTGYEAAINEAGRKTEEKPELDEDEKEELDRKLAQIAKNRTEHQKLTVVYFVADEFKNGGNLMTFKGMLKRINVNRGSLEFEDGTVIRFSDITGLSIA